MIVLFTDFGTTGPYMGQMRARIQDLASKEQIIDLMVDAPAFNVSASAKLLAGLVKPMPKEAIYVCVVDPGVGSDRRALCIKTQYGWFVGPDNGLFEYIIRNDSSSMVYEIIWRPDELSSSFHGRDLFGPVAAMLASQQEFEKNLIDKDTLVELDDKDEPGQVIYIDCYGNCWTDIDATTLSKSDLIIYNGIEISFSRVFSDTAVGTLFWYVNSSGFVEIAKNQGHGAQQLNIALGSRFTIKK
ncbi:MAG: SAM-dependent chlorinase/fluorinase [Methylocystaceae bacterium]|nr:SAM-dependent chlorinase/fluorinase [Methylocystaceae bacterium]